MFYILCKNVGGRIHDRYFHDYENCLREYYKCASDAIKAGWTVSENIHRSEPDKDFEETEIKGKTKDGEDFYIAIINGYWEDESSKEILESNKVYSYLVWRHNIFHADMIHRAVNNEDVSEEDFISGCKKIYEQEENGEDEYTPEEFAKV